jgi:hypothetical protein
MTVTIFDPFRAESAMRWQNRMARWRANPAETTFHAAALLALAAVVLWPLPTLATKLAPTEYLHAALAQWPLAVACAVFVAMLLRQGRILANEHTLTTTHWLATQPLATRFLQRRQHHRQWREVGLQIAAIAVSLALAQADLRMLVVAVPLAVIAAFLAPRLPRVGIARAATNLRLRSAVVDPGRGRLWRWQKIETGIAFRGRSLAGGALILLLVPMGSHPLAIALTLGCGLAVAWLLTAWRRSVAVVPAAQAWLGPLPLSAVALLRGTLTVPMLVLVAAAALLVSGFAAFGAARFGGLAALAVVALATLHFGCVAAHRSTPRRAGVAFALQVALLIGVLQALPLLVPLLWLAQLGWLGRAAVRA